MTQMIRFRRSSLALAMLAATAIGTNAQITPAQTTPSQITPPTFDVASIHLHTPQPHEHNQIWSASSDGNLTTSNISLKALIQFAFNMPKSRIVGAPDWTTSQFFDIEAKSTDDTLNQRLHDLPSEQAKPIKLAMIQALLADRFGLKTHREQRVLPIYELVAAKDGPKLTPSKSGGLTINDGRDHFNGKGITMPLLAQELAQYAGRVIIDKSGITGRFDIDLRWQPDDAPPTSNDAAYPPFFTALQEQLGLRLEPAKGPVDVLVIDAVHQPTAN